MEMVKQPPPKAPDSEKITINLGYVDLGHIDLLVAQGFYSNRSDFIRTAIRTLLDRHDSTLKQTVARQQLDLGLRHYSRHDLERVRASGEMLTIQVARLPQCFVSRFYDGGSDDVVVFHEVAAVVKMVWGMNFAALCCFAPKLRVDRASGVT
jgi:Arc/MetJ-type ribon-helix-helix transcriptional regulator